MAITLSNAVAIAACNAIVDLVDAGTGTAKLRIYDGSRPANPDVAVGAQNLLAEIDLQDPAYGDAVDANPGGQATMQGLPLSDTSVNATGTASWFRIVDKDGTAVIDGSVATSGADLNVDSTSFEAGTTFEITSSTFTMPES